MNKRTLDLTDIYNDTYIVEKYCILNVFYIKDRMAAFVEQNGTFRLLYFPKDYKDLLKYIDKSK